MPDVIPTGPTVWKSGKRNITVCRVDELFEVEVFSRHKICYGDIFTDANGNRYEVENGESIETSFANARLLVRKLYPSQTQD